MRILGFLGTLLGTALGGTYKDTDGNQQTLMKTVAGGGGEHDYSGNLVPGVAITPQYADLMYADLRGADLQNIDFRNADLVGADLRGADMRSANFESTNFEDVKITSMCGPGTQFDDASSECRIDPSTVKQAYSELCD